MAGTFTAVMDDGTLVEARPTLNIIGATVTDNATANRTDVAINSPDGDMTLAANKSLIGTAGTGALTLGSMTGATQLPTGNLGWAGASTKTLSLVSTAASVTIKSTTSGTVLVDSAGVLNVGTTDATSVNVGKATVPVTAPGGVTMATAKKLLAGTNEIVGTVADKINPVHIAHAAQAVGDLLVADGATTMTRLADVAVGQVLASGGVGVAPAYTASPSVASVTVTTGVTVNDGALIHVKGAGAGTGDVVTRYGGTATEGLEIVVFDDVISPAAVETNVINVPTNSVIYSVQGNCQAALTGGGTTVTWSLGTTGDPDKYGTAGDGGGDSLAQNSKANWTATPTRLGSAEQIVLTGAATGGAADGDTALTVGSVRVRVVYATCNALDNA